MSLLIRKATERDLPAIMKIERQCFPMPWPESAFLIHIWNEEYIVLAAELDSQLAGYMCLQYVLDEGYISNVATSQLYRRRGVASALIAAMTAQAQHLGLSFMTLEVRESNSSARALYAAHGFIDAGRRKAYYEHPEEDAILMTLFLSEETKA